MKRTILVLATISSISAFASAKEIKVAVKGMVCGFCAQGIEKKFKSESAVERVHVSLERKVVTIETKKDQDLPDSKIETIIKDAGYNIDKIERQ